MKADLFLLDRIVINPRAMVGKPIVRGTRLTVEYILNSSIVFCHDWDRSYVARVTPCLAKRRAKTSVADWPCWSWS